MSLSGGETRDSESNELSVAMFAPVRRRCGISDYTNLLLNALNALPHVIARTLEAPGDVVPGGGMEALKRYGAEERRFQALGVLLNGGMFGYLADVAHIQHQYFFFGGVAPHKSHIRALLNAVKIPLVMTVHEIAQAGETASYWKQAAIRLANRRNFLHPAIRRFLVHTGSDREKLIEIGVPSARIQVVTHGVPQAEPMPESVAAKRELGLEGRRVVTLFGFLAAKKGHRLALEALKRLPPEVILLFAGDQHPDDQTDYVPELRAEMERAELLDRVRITGYLPAERIPVVMAATDVAIAPFSQTSGSGSLANLLAYHRPVVASDIPPHREIAAESPVCLALFESGSAADLAFWIQHLLENMPARIALQSAAQEYASRHSYLEMARQTVEIYTAIRQEISA